MPLPPSKTICMCSHPHTHSFFLSVMRYKDHIWEPLCAPSSLISACSVSTWVKLVAGSKEFFSETGLMPETLCGGSVFKFYHSSPIRSYIYYSWQAREVKRDWKRWETLKLYFLLRIKSTKLAFFLSCLLHFLCYSYVGKCRKLCWPVYIFGHQTPLHHISMSRNNTKWDVVQVNYILSN